MTGVRPCQPARWTAKSSRNSASTSPPSPSKSRAEKQLTDYPEATTDGLIAIPSAETEDYTNTTRVSHKGYPLFVSIYCAGRRFLAANGLFGREGLRPRCAKPQLPAPVGAIADRTFLSSFQEHPIRSCTTNLRVSPLSSPTHLRHISDTTPRMVRPQSDLIR